MRRTFGVLIVLMSATLLSSAQTQKAPPWPDIRISSPLGVAPWLGSLACPAIAAPVTPRQLTWKHGQSEQSDFEQMKGQADVKQGIDLLIAFARKYPDSDYNEPALLAALGLTATLKDVNGQVRLGMALTNLPSAQAVSRVAGYVALDTDLSTSVSSTDPDKTRKIADLEAWTRCGMEALKVQVRPDNVQPEAFEKNRQYSESKLVRTQGFVALLREDYRSAIPQLEKAAQLNPQDALTYLWLGESYILSPIPDSAKGVFYLARATELSPQVPATSALVKQLYVIDHGSDKGLGEVIALAKSNAAPPAGFVIQPPPTPKQHHYGTAVAATAIIGLLVYGAARCPECFAGSSGDSTPSATANQKTMIFGGPDHRTYLGCLNCSENAPDSVFNETGRNGNRDSADSIWNHYGQYGSPYSQFSACDPDATDAPVIVDENGKAYGRVTANQYATDIGAGAQLYQWLVSAVCAN